MPVPFIGPMLAKGVIKGAAKKGAKAVGAAAGSKWGKRSLVAGSTALTALGVGTTYAELGGPLPGDAKRRRASLEDLLSGAEDFDLTGETLAMEQENEFLRMVGRDRGTDVVGEILASAMLDDVTHQLVRGREKELGDLAMRQQREASLRELAFRLGVS